MMKVENEFGIFISKKLLWVVDWGSFDIFFSTITTQSNVEPSTPRQTIIHPISKSEGCSISVVKILLGEFF